MIRKPKSCLYFFSSLLTTPHTSLSHREGASLDPVKPNRPRRWSPYSFLHWDVLNRLMPTALLEEGDCACALCQCTRGKKKHTTQTFFGISRSHDLWFPSSFDHKHLVLYECKDLQPHLTVAPLAKPDCLRMWPFRCVFCFYHFTWPRSGVIIILLCEHVCVMLWSFNGHVWLPLLSTGHLTELQSPTDQQEDGC